MKLLRFAVLWAFVVAVATIEFELVSSCSRGTFWPGYSSRLTLAGGCELEVERGKWISFSNLHIAGKDSAPGFWSILESN